MAQREQFSFVLTYHLVRGGVLASILGVLLACSPLVTAQPKNSTEMSLDAAVAALRKETNARVLSAEKYKQDNIYYYRIKLLLANGSIRVVLIDPATGKRID